MSSMKQTRSYSECKGVHDTSSQILLHLQYTASPTAGGDAGDEQNSFGLA